LEGNVGSRKKKGSSKFVGRSAYVDGRKKKKRLVQLYSGKGPKGVGQSPGAMSKKKDRLSVGGNGGEGDRSKIRPLSVKGEGPRSGEAPCLQRQESRKRTPERPRKSSSTAESEKGTGDQGKESGRKGGNARTSGRMRGRRSSSNRGNGEGGVEGNFAKRRGDIRFTEEAVEQESRVEKGGHFRPGGKFLGGRGRLLILSERRLGRGKRAASCGGKTLTGLRRAMEEGRESSIFEFEASQKKEYARRSGESLLGAFPVRRNRFI